jgi:hypothetical protein
MTIRWSVVQEFFVSEAAEHWKWAQSFGLDCPWDVFEQLFHDHHGNEVFASVVRFVDWKNVTWEERKLSGVALRHVAVPRAYQRAVDEVRWRTLEEGVQDDRPEIVDHWHTAGTWLRLPIIVAGEIFGSPLGNECLVGFTRLGNLLGLLDRQEIPESCVHRIWLGRPSEARNRR